MTTLIIIMGLLSIVGFIYMFATERTVILLNIIMLAIGIIIPAITIGLVVVAKVRDDPTYLTQLVDLIPWWGYVLGIIVDVFCYIYLIFVPCEQLEDVFDNDGNKIGTKGGTMGITFLSFALTLCLSVALFTMFL